MLPLHSAAAQKLPESMHDAKVMLAQRTNPAPAVSREHGALLASWHYTLWANIHKPPGTSFSPLCTRT